MKAEAEKQIVDEIVSLCSMFDPLNLPLLLLLYR